MKRKYFWGITLLVLLFVVGTWFFINRTGEQTASNTLFYVPNAGEGTISVVDYVKGERIDTINLGSDQASHGIALGTDGKTLYAGTGFDGKTLVAIDTKTKDRVKEILFDEGVHGIDISPDGKTLYVSLNPGLGKKGGMLAILDTATLEQKAIVETGEAPAHVAVTADGSQVWTANVNDNTVSVVDAETAKVIGTVVVGNVPNEVTVMPDSRYAFAANVGSNTVSVIDMKSLEVIKEIEAGEAPHGVSVSPDGKELWVSNNNSNDVTVVSTDSFRVLATIPTGAFANHVGFTQDGKWAFVSNRQSNDIVKINREERTIEARIPVGSEPHEISLEDVIVPISSPVVDSTEESADTLVKSGLLGTAELTVQRLMESDLIDDPNLSEVKTSDFEEYVIYSLSLSAHSGDISNLLDEQKVSLQGKEGKAVSSSRWLVASNDAHHPYFLAWFPKIESITPVQMNIIGPNAEPLSLTWDSL